MNTTLWMQQQARILSLLAAVTLTACGGGSDGDSGSDNGSGGGQTPVPTVTPTPTPTTTPTSTPTSTPTPTSEPLGKLSAKRGLAYGHHSAADLAAMQDRIAWWYNWGVAPESSAANVYLNYGMEYVPMAWNSGFNESALRAYLDQHPDAQYLLGFNEPNFREQANMTPQQAADAWPVLEAIASDYGLELVAPAVNFSPGHVEVPGGENNSPWAYLDAFFAACDGCQVDYIAVHCYMETTGAFTWFIGEFERYGIPIWVTEWAAWDGPGPANVGAQMDYLADTVRWMEANDMVHRYAWFIGRTDGGPSAFPYLDILGDSGEFTPLGHVYANIPATDFYYRLNTRIEAESATTVSGFKHQTTNDSDGAVHLYDANKDDFLGINVDVEHSTEVELELRVASAGGAGVVQIFSGEQLLTSIGVSATGGAENWQTQSHALSLPAGKQQIRIVVSTGGFNLNWVKFTEQ